MKSEELASLFDQVEDLLQKNQEAVGGEKLATMTKYLDILKSNEGLQTMVAASTNTTPEDVKSMLATADKFMAMEHQLTQTQLTEQITTVLEKVKNNKFVMSIVSAMLK